MMSSVKFFSHDINMSAFNKSCMLIGPCPPVWVQPDPKVPVCGPPPKCSIFAPVQNYLKRARATTSILPAFVA